MNGAHSAVGRLFSWVAVIALIIGLTALFQALTSGTDTMMETTTGDGRAVLVLRRERSGHYFARGMINGQAVDFLVDTGATDVAISESRARALGLDFGPEIRVMTAAGPAKAWLTRLDQVQVGNLALRNVRASITPGLGAQALLGMSFLKHFSLRQEDDQLMIESRGASQQ